MLSATVRRPLAAIWFGLFGFLAAGIFFLRPDVKLPALCLYVVFPGIAGAIAGAIWGGTILDPVRTPASSVAILRGVGVAAGAFLVFAVLFALGLPLLEKGWRWSQAAGLVIATLTLGLLMVGPLIAISGMVAGLTLFLLGRRASTAPGDQAPDGPAI
ncbi:MAG TPA: hypothetical protein VHN74_03530 [Candidatus Angelobacter sp.]|jgi:hypothetical protein|nr:hypothetical protein [Candidatus Angelobacter sp.]